MEETNQTNKLNLSKLAWQHFVEKGELMPGVRPVVARSWFRSKKYGLDPYEQPKNSLHNNENQTILSAKSQQEQAVIRKGLEQCLAWLNSEAILMLIHNSRVIVETVGSLPLSFLPLLQPGQVISERVFGTFGPALALQGEKLVEVLGYEHFLACFHNFRSTGVHFFRDEEPWLLGLVLPLEKSGPQVLGLLQAVAQILSTQLQNYSSTSYPSGSERPKITPLAELERLEIIKALKVCEGNITHAALMLGISRNTLYNRMKKYDIEVS